MATSHFSSLIIVVFVIYSFLALFISRATVDAETSHELSHLAHPNQTFRSAFPMGKISVLKNQITVCTGADDWLAFAFERNDCLGALRKLDIEEVELLNNDITPFTYPRKAYTPRTYRTRKCTLAVVMLESFPRLTPKVPETPH